MSGKESGRDKDICKLAEKAQRDFVCAGNKFTVFTDLPVALAICSLVRMMIVISAICWRMSMAARTDTILLL